jgi:hypothetical protein
MSASIENKNVEHKGEDLDLKSLDSSSDGEVTILVKSSPTDVGKEFKATEKEIQISKFLHNLYEEHESHNHTGTLEIFLDGSTGVYKYEPFVIFDVILKYMKLCQGVDGEILEIPLKSSKMIDHFKDERFAKFIDSVVDNFKEPKLVNMSAVVHVANYLGINSLVYQFCAKIAIYIRGKETEEILDFTHGVPNEYRAKPIDIEKEKEKKRKAIAELDKNNADDEEKKD